MVNLPAQVGNVSSDGGGYMLFYGTGGVASDQPDSVMFKVFDATTNALVAGPGFPQPGR